MVNIPLAPRGHRDTHRPTETRTAKTCRAKAVCLGLEKNYQHAFYPVCPALRQWMGQDEETRLPALACILEKTAVTINIPHASLPLLKSIMKILTVLLNLAKLTPDPQTLARYMHTKHFLKRRLDLIGTDLAALPQRLEKDFPDTSKRCRELIESLRTTDLNCVVSARAYLAPPDDLRDGNWGALAAWHKQQTDSAGPFQGLAKAITIMGSLLEELCPIANILAESHRQANGVDCGDNGARAAIAMLKELRQEWIALASGDRITQHAVGAVSPDRFKWQSVQAKIEQRWKRLKKEDKPFPSFKWFAKDLGENEHTVKKAIGYSRSLTMAYNKDKPEPKKVRYVDPSIVAVVAKPRTGKHKDADFLADQECLANCVREKARQLQKDFDPDVAATGRMVLKNWRIVRMLPPEGLKEMLAGLTEKRKHLKAQLIAAFEMDRLK